MFNLHCRKGFLLGIAFLAAAGVVAVFCSEGRASSTVDKLAARTFSLYFENDLFTGSDRHYTNGTKLTWVSPDLSTFEEYGPIPKSWLPYIDYLPFVNEPGLLRNVAFFIGQNMYTPEDIEVEHLIPEDRPYAGWTYLGVSFQSKNSRRLDTVEFQVGMIGPASMAEQTQKFVHTVVHSPEPRGWDHQLANEPGLALILERKSRMFLKESSSGWGADGISFAGLSLGNVQTYINAGLELRLGLRLPRDFGSSLIRPAGDSSAPAGQDDPRLKGWEGFGWHFFGSINGRAMARDVFLDGNTFSDSHCVSKKRFVVDMAAGLCMTAGRFKITYAYAMRTKEFKGQRRRDNFGAVSVSFTY
jgi:lipid A 3-O-deacylase